MLPGSMHWRTQGCGGVVSTRIQENSVSRVLVVPLSIPTFVENIEDDVTLVLGSHNKPCSEAHELVL